MPLFNIDKRYKKMFLDFVFHFEEIYNLFDDVISTILELLCFCFQLRENRRIF